MLELGFLDSLVSNRATTTAARWIWRSKIMTLGVTCEILAGIAAVLNWVNNFWWLPNVTLTLATLGAVVVASRVAWDYHGRGLNAKQSDDVNSILTDASLNETQRNEITETIQSHGLTPRQKLDLDTALYETRVANTVEAQKAIFAARDYLRAPDHGHVAVIYTVGFGRLDVRYVDPPPTRGECQRQHAHEHGATLDDVKVATSLFQGFTNPTVLWKHPADGNFCHTNYDTNGDRGAPANELIFSFEDCVPKWRVPLPGDYVLKHDATSGSAWEQKPQPGRASTNGSALPGPG